MATLEKIRSKSVLLFTIIIVALLAFIMGDFLTSGRNFFGTGDTVATANGAKVDYNTYRERLNQQAEEQKNQNRPQPDNDVLSQQTINELLVESLLKQEYDNLGITVTDKQLGDLMLGENTAPQIYYQLMQQFGPYAQALQQKGIVDVRNFYDAMKSPAKYGLGAEEGQMMTQVWTNLEKSLDQSLKSQAYAVLVQGLFTANDVDARALYNDRNTATQISYVRKDFTSVPDDKVKIEDADYEKVYNEHKGGFRLPEETRAVSFITVAIVPGEADYKAGEKEVEEVIAQLSATEGTSAMTNHTAFDVQTGKLTKTQMSQNPQLRAMLADSVNITAGMVKPLVAVAGNYSIVKVLETTTGIDRVKFSMLPMLAADADSLLANATVATFDSIARQNGGYPAVETSLINPTVQLDQKMLDALATKAVGQIVTLNDTVTTQDKDGKAVKQAVTNALLITERDAAVPVYELAQITYTVEPSQKTVADLNAKFHAYVGNNANAKAFAENAEKNGYQVGKTLVSASTPLVQNNANSRGAVKWAMKNDKGDVSPVFTFKGNGNSNDYLLAVAIDDVYGGDYLPVTAETVREQLKPIVLNNKKAEKVMADLKGKAKDLNGYAAAMGSPVEQAEVVFGDDQITGVGYGEQAIQGKTASAAKGKMVGPFQGNTAIYVLTVDGQTNQGRPYGFEENAQMFANKYVQAMLSDPLRLLVGDNKIKNNVLEFVADEAN